MGRNQQTRSSGELHNVAHLERTDHFLPSSVSHHIQVNLPPPSNSIQRSVAFMDHQTFAVIPDTPAVARKPFQQLTFTESHKQCVAAPVAAAVQQKQSQEPPKFKCIKKLGNGAYATVWLAIDQLTGCVSVQHLFVYVAKCVRSSELTSFICDRL
jgi:hypothetical protein